LDTLFLETLIAVVNSGTLVDAARQMNVTPGAVAQRLQTLEAEMGTKLVMRAGRTVRPTEAGAKLALRARSVLRDFNDLRFVVDDDILSGELRIGAIATALTGMIPHILGRLVRLHSKIEVFIEPGSSERLYRRVHNGDLDAAIIVKPGFPIPKVLDWVNLRKEPLIVIASTSTTQDDPHALLMSHPFISYDKNQWGGYLAERYLQQAGLAPKVRFELDALDAIAVMVDQDLGVSLIPDWAPPWPQGLSLKKIPLSRPHQNREVGLIWNQGSSRIRLIDAFQKEAMGHAQTA